MMVYLVFSIILAACAEKAAIDPLEIGDRERGRDIFETGAEITNLVCSNCHSLDGSINEEHQAPSLQGIAKHAGKRDKDLLAIEYLRQSIVDPSAHIVEGYKSDMDISYKYLFSEED